MSTPRGFGLNGKSFYTNVANPKEVSLQFTVTPTNGLGVTSVKSNGYVNNVFMHTSTTPAANNGYTNPNPANGYVAIQFKNNFNYYLNNSCSIQTPTATSKKIDNAELTVGQTYVITTLGDATAAQWAAVGVPPGITPAVGVSFVAIATGSGSGNSSTSRMQLPTTSGIYVVETVGNPGVMLSNSNIASNGGAWLLAQFMAPTFTAGAYTPAGTVAAPVLTMNSYTPAGVITNGTPDTFAGTPATLTGTNSAPAFTGTAASLTGTLALAAAAPATGSVVSMRLYYDGSSVTIDGI